MALNRDFRVKDSLYVGTSGYFANGGVSIDTVGSILSAGTDLLDIFQDIDLATLDNGTCIAAFTYNGDSAATVSLSGYEKWDNVYTDVNATSGSWDSVYTSVNTTSGDWDSVYSSYNSASGSLVDSITNDGNQGDLKYSLNGDAANTTVDLGLCTTDDVTFNTVDGTAGVCGNDVTIGVAGAAEISTSAGNLTLDSTGGTVTVDDNLNVTTDHKILSAGQDLWDFFAVGDITAVTAGNYLTGGGSSGDVTVGLDSACAANWNTGYDWVDTNGNNVFDGVTVGGGLSQGQVTLNAIDSPTQDETVTITGLGSTDTPTFGGLTINGGLSAVSLSGDGSALTNLSATPIFPTDEKTDLASTDKFFIHDDSSKYVTYLNLLTDLAGTGIDVEGDDSLAVAGAASLSLSSVPYWNGSSFISSAILHTADGITIAGDTTVTGDLSVTGDFTYIDTTVSVTSALSVNNAGTGPALWVGQTGVQPIAHFVDRDGGDIVFADDGKVGIGTYDPAEKLTVSGNISANGTLQIDTLAAGTTDSVIISDSGLFKTRTIDDRVWSDGCLVDTSGGTSNKVSKFSGDSNTIVDSCITDDGTTVTVAADLKVDSDKTFCVLATGGSIYSEEKTFTATVGSSGTTVATFPKADFTAGKYVVALINGNNKTVFEVLATYNENSSDSFGTVYAIVDGQDATLLTSVNVTNASTTIDLVITSVDNSTTAIIQGKAMYQ